MRNTSATQWLLTKRVMLPVIVAFLLLNYFGGSATHGVLFMVTQATVILPAAYMLRRRTHADTLFKLCIAAELTMTGIPLSLIIGGDNTVGAIGLVSLATSQLLFGVAAVMLLRIRRPKHFGDGLIDGAAALIGFTAIQWQLLFAADLDELKRSADRFVPIVVGLMMVAIFVILGRLLFDRNQSRTAILSVVFACTCLTIAVLASGTYQNADAPFWAHAFANFAGYFLGAALLHPGFLEFCRPETDYGNRMSVVRWLGPASALIVTPSMFLLLLLRDEPPSLPVASAAVLLTATVLLRIGRLLREREASRDELAGSEQRFRSLVQHSADIIAVLDADRRVSYVSGGFEAMFGVAPSMVMGERLTALLDPSDVEALRDALLGADTPGVPVALGRDVRLRRPDGEHRWASVIVTNHLAEPSIRGWVINVHDVTERKQAEQALSRLAMHDALTGLPNRTQLLDVLERSVTRRPGRTALLFCDLDGFKAINDILGHDAGDEVLQVVAGRWSAQLRGEDSLGRWGGDEFLVVCPDVAGLDAAQDIADRLVAALAEPLVIPGGSARLGCSIGVVVHRPGESAEALVGRADVAMYEVKRAAGGVHTA